MHWARPVSRASRWPPPRRPRKRGTAGTAIAIGIDIAGTGIGICTTPAIGTATGAGGTTGTITIGTTGIIAIGTTGTTGITGETFRPAARQPQSCRAFGRRHGAYAGNPGRVDVGEEQPSGGRRELPFPENVLA